MYPEIARGMLKMLRLVEIYPMVNDSIHKHPFVFTPPLDKLLALNYRGKVFKALDQFCSIATNYS